MKRIAFALIKIILLSIFYLSPGTIIASEEEVHITVESQSGLVPGQNVNISLLMNNNFMIQSGSLFLYYDPDILTPLSPYCTNVATGASLAAYPIGAPAGKYMALEIDILSDKNYGPYTYNICDLTFQFHGGITTLVFATDSSYIYDPNGNYCYINFTIGNASGTCQQVTSKNAGDWNTESTWNPENIPNRSTDAIIANMPVIIQGNTGQRCHNLTMGPASGLTLNQ